jgi:hypothetical protein
MATSLRTVNRTEAICCGRTKNTGCLAPHIGSCRFPGLDMRMLWLDWQSSIAVVVTGCGLEG